MVSPKDEFDDAFFEFVGELVARKTVLEQTLRHIQDTCPDRRTQAVAEAALVGNYPLPDAERP